jgi:cytochrome b subunit of formate dehydrogenase
MKVNRTARYLLFLALASLSILVAVSALLLWVVFPRGFFASRAVWVDIHKWSGLTLSLAVILHVILHRNWMKAMTRGFLTRWRIPR